MQYFNKKTKQTVHAEPEETTKIAILTRKGFRPVEDETPTIPPAGALNPQEGPEGAQGAEVGKDTSEGQKSALRPADAGTEALQKPAEETKENFKPLSKKGK